MEQLPIRVSEASGEPYDRQIVSQIAALIRQGRLVPGAPIAPAAELAAQLRVSLDTARRAYDRLEQMRLIRRREGGACVAAQVGEALHVQAQAEARCLLAEAFARARGLGLGNAALRALCAELLLPEDRAYG